MEQKPVLTTQNLRPSPIPWPPLLYGVALLGSWLLERWIPSFIVGLKETTRHWGALPASVGVIFDITAMIVLFRAHTTVLPNRGASHLVTTGPYALSRNPIYLGNALVLTGMAIWFSSAWLAGLTIVCIFLVARLAIMPEEAHLRAKFGSDWEVYCRRVGRWLLFV